MWVGNVGNALLHFLFSVNNTLSLRQRVQIYLGPTFVERPNEIFKTKLCLTECTPKQFWTKKTTLESWSNNKNPFWSRWGVKTNGSRPSHYINAIPTSHYDLFLSWVIFSTDKISLRNGGKIRYYNISSGTGPKRWPQQNQNKGQRGHILSLLLAEVIWYLVVCFYIFCYINLE